MIYAAGKWLYGAFALVARDAARRFVGDRRSSSRRRSFWRPISLRWQRRRRHQVNLSAARSASRAPVVLFPQFHFHYTTHRNEQTHHDRVPGPAAATRLAATRAVLVSHWSTLHARALSPQPHPAHRAWLSFDAHQNSRRNIDAGLIGTLGSAKMAGSHSITPSALNRLRPRQLEQTAEPVRPGRWRKEQTPPFLTQSRSWQHRLQVFHSRSLIADPAPDRSQPNKASRIQVDRPEELVWRRVIRPTTEVAEAERRQEVSDSVPRPALRTFQSQEATPKSAPIEQSTAAQIIKLDPSFLDRLTDDVIRRVEKRAQIERQRRGL
jgi:hypothetical protein